MNFLGNLVSLLGSRLDVVMVACYLIITLILGIIVARKVKTFEEFAIGSRRYPTVVIGMTICATLIGGGSSMGTATEVFKFGIIVMLAKYGVSFGALIIAMFIIPRMEKFFGMLSIGEVMKHMYGKSVGVITGICGVLLCVGRVAAQVMALGFVVQYLFGYSETIGILSSAIILVIYSSLGGVRSVVFTDILQFIALFITIPMVLNLGLKKIGGYTGLIEALPAHYLDVYPDGRTFIKYLAVFVYMSIPMLTPPFTQRILMSKSINQAKKSFMLMACTDFVFTTIAGTIGLIAYVYNSNIAPNAAFLNIIYDLQYVFKGLGVIGMLSVIMSTADSYLNAASVCLVHDILNPLNLCTQPNQKLQIARISTVVVGGMSITMALYFENIFELAIYASNFWGPIVVGPLLIGILGFKITSYECVAAMLAGVITFCVWENWSLKDVTTIYSVFPAIVMNIMASLLMSMFIKRESVYAK